MDSKTQTAIKVHQECFWGDYRLAPDDILDRLSQNNPDFNRFLFSKIIENSSFPSKHLTALFPRKELLKMLERYLKISNGKQRVRLVAANITGNHDLVPELQWKR